MAKSAILKSSLLKKYWMAATGLFLCLFLLGHLIGNLQLIFSDASKFNQYALFMTTNPAIKVMSYLTYASIIFHAIDGIMLTIENKKARPIGYVKNTPQANSAWTSRNMAVLGTVILVFIVTHMANFWAKMHFDKNMPLYTELVNGQQDKEPVIMLTNGQFISPNFLAKSEAEAKELNKPLYVKDRTQIMLTQQGVKFGEAYKDLYKITVDFFKDAQYGLIATILYVLSMVVLAFHLDHGFASAFQSLGMRHPKYTGIIRTVGKAFAYIVPALFAIIPLYIHFVLK